MFDKCADIRLNVAGFHTDMILRPDQEEVTERLRDGYRKGAKRVVLAAPTGWGKTVVFSFYAKSAVSKGLRVLIGTHRAEILDQICGTLDAVGVPHGTIAAGEHMDPRKPVQVASIPTLLRRFDKVRAPDLVILDEVHHAVSKTWAQLFANYSAAFFLGVSATPERLDGRGLGEFFDTLVEGPTTGWLIERNLLARPRYFGVAPSSAPDISGVHKLAGDFNRGELEDLMDKPAITGDAVEHYRRLCPDRTAIAFTVSLKHAEHVCQQFNDAGISSRCIDGTMTKQQRRAIIDALRAGTVRVLVSVDLVSEGFDLPAVGAAILLRHTASLALHRQQVGRSLRQAPGKTCIASGSRVLTRRGLVPIEAILHCDLIWDGVEFVRHGGLINQGIRNVIYYDGLWATEDHLVATQKGWKTFGECASKQMALITSGRGRTPIWECSYNLKSDRSEDERRNQSGLRSLRMQNMREAISSDAHQSERRSNAWLQELQPTKTFSEMVLCEVPINAGAMRESEFQTLQILWRSRNSIQIQFSIRCCALDTRPYRHSGSFASIANRQDRQRWALRALEFAVVNQSPELLPFSEEQTLWQISSFQAESSQYYVRGLDSESLFFDGTFGGSNRTTFSQSIPQAKRQVWDIYACGPRNCFTVEGKLVHNCSVILDHVGNTLRHGPVEEPIEWTLEGGAAKKRAKERPVETQQCPSCYAIFSGPACPQCGSIRQIKPRQIDQRNGVLREMSAEDIAKAREAKERRMEEGRCRSLEDFQRIAAIRGYRNGWAFMRWQLKRKYLGQTHDAKPTLRQEELIQA